MAYDGYGNVIEIGTGDVGVYDIPIITGVCPHVYITCEGTNLPQLTKNNAVNGTIEFDDGKNKFKLYTKMKAQGDQSLNYDQKQINATLYSDEACKKKQKVKFNDWMPLSKFHIKSHPQDPLQARNVVVASMLQKLMGTRLPQGAWGFIKAIPIILHWNGEFVGCYNWTTPQDGKTFNFSDSKELACENLAYRFGGEYRGDEDETAEMTAVKDAIFAILDDTQNLTKTIVEEHFDVTSILQMICAIEWFCMGDVGVDNGLLVTWNGSKWYTLPYDFDWCAWGRTNWTNTKQITNAKAYQPIQFLYACEQLYSDEIKEVYASMRKNGMDVDTLMQTLTNYVSHWNYKDRAEDISKWPQNPYYADDATLSTIRSTMTRRCAYVDSLYEYTE
jgi:hypothetical protein